MKDYPAAPPDMAPNVLHPLCPSRQVLQMLTSRWGALILVALAGRTLPPIEQVPGESVPEPYRQLLVHQDDMTPTLEKFHGDRVHLTIVQRAESKFLE